MCRYEKIKRRIAKLNNGWDREADDVLTEIGIKCNIEISIQGQSGGVITVESDCCEKSFAKEFIFSSNQDDKMKAFQTSLLYILDSSSMAEEI